MQTTLEQLKQWLDGATVHNDAGALADVSINGATTDSRAVVPGNLFIALRGERFDAHDFLDAVAAQGAAAVVVERVPAGLKIPAIVVSDTRVALGRIARHWRQQFKLPLIAVTGSNGKTTVKEMIASILAADFGEDRSMATRGNFNNEIGVPLTLFRLQPQHQAAVVELGMNHPGEIAVLAEIARPTLALVNNAQREHQEFMATVEAVARENGAVFAALPADGIAVFPAEDDYAWVWREIAGARPVISFGLNPDANVSATYQVREFGSAIAVNADIDGRSQQFGIKLAAVGEHNVRNALAATACALGAGIAVAAIVRGLEAFAPVNGRLQRKAAASGALVIDDTYNANPDSVRAAIDVLAQTVAPRVLALGDMGEVGNEGPKFHREIGAYARERGIEHFFGFGDAMRDAIEAYNSAPGAAFPARHFDTVDAIGAATREVAVAAATVLVKGSRFMKMERVVQHLVGAQLQTGAPLHQETH
ncbi:UDP-N-acetylmuramoyl-tripeptide--D-alanyl-D-alanine ligase [Herbaspirillum lusitanum]|uniref:UDP-N-acetylmuramoyl-tripeptide--D-alanyl-D- alanine ligase n=1 Tax=Herbaspirillum lusitanum TaxID=213312 RepID=UPI002238B0CE|nr:UDP-N-acetylmuramoyl-tripeptide--D-alanyl-D-alanine ligase [Herbaspirillum lusitanum]MCW5296754.1 UDP-N-acetylmuramoyl-tripeptide--D-alanyl-D-alanine ligase [Herbaspirillum lusitanum]